MLVKSRIATFLVLAALAAVLVGCAGIAVANPVMPVSDQAVAAEMQYLDGPEVGPLYNVSLTVPEDWVGKFETRSEGNTVYFDYITQSGAKAPIFFIEALSSIQYWNQTGAAPGSYNDIINLGETHLIYHMPIDAYYSGLPEEEFTALTEAVPGIISTVVVESAN